MLRGDFFGQEGQELSHRSDTWYHCELASECCCDKLIGSTSLSACPDGATPPPWGCDSHPENTTFGSNGLPASHTHTHFPPVLRFSQPLGHVYIGRWIARDALRITVLTMAQPATTDGAGAPLAPEAAAAARARVGVTTVHTVVGREATAPATLSAGLRDGGCRGGPAWTRDDGVAAPRLLSVVVSDPDA